MPFLFCVALLMLSSGCAVSGGPGSRLLPWNWFSSDSTGMVEKAQNKLNDANAALRDQSHRMSLATELSLTAEKNRQLEAGGTSREIDTASEYSHRTVQALDTSEGVLGFDVQRELSAMVTARNAELVTERSKGDKYLSTQDQTADKAAVAQSGAERLLATAHTQVAAEQQRALVAEEKYHRLWFYALLAIGIFLLLQLIPLIAHAFPAFAPFATAASWIAAPAVQAGYSTLRSSVGKIIHTAEKGGSIAINAIREQIDGPNSRAEQNEIRRHYNKAKIASDPSH